MREVVLSGRATEGVSWEMTASDPPRRFPRLLPPDGEEGWLPYLWLIYLPPLFWAPATSGAPWQWAATAVAIPVFLWAYFRAHWVSGRRVLPLIGVQVILGVAFATWNPAAPTFFIFAASFAARFGRRRETIALLGAILLVTIFTPLVAGGMSFFWLFTFVFTPVVGIINLQAAEKSRADAQLRLAQEEVSHLAAVAERERIARDLHDVLGHTLSLIVLKSELAARLVDRDASRAGREIRDVEHVARKALAEVREAIRGYRGTLEDKVARARVLLHAAGIAGEFDARPARMVRAAEEALALALREGVTNAVRHSGASVCRVRAASANGVCTLEIEDDGRGGAQPEGSGLRGMRERLEVLGGRVDWRRDRSGTTLTVTVPVGDPSPVLAALGSESGG